MEKRTQTNGAKSQNAYQGFIGDPQVYLNDARGTLVHRIGNARIEMPINLYKQILGIPFSPKAETKDVNADQRVLNAFGFVARPAIYLTKDGQYLVHRVLGVRIAKHVHYYKKILGGAFEPKRANLE